MIKMVRYQRLGAKPKQRGSGYSECVGEFLHILYLKIVTQTESVQISPVQGRERKGGETGEGTR